MLTRVLTYMGWIAIGACCFALGFLLTWNLSLGAAPCSTPQCRLYGAGPNDLNSAAYRYTNYRIMLARTREQLKRDEIALASVRARRPQLFHFASRRVDQDRANAHYYAVKFSSASSALAELSDLRTQ